MRSEGCHRVRAAGPGLSFVLQRDDILTDDAAVASKLGQAVALGENPGEPHRALAAWAAGSVEFVVFIRHGQRAMLMKPQVKKGRSGGEPDRPIRALLRTSAVTLPDDRDPSLWVGVPRATAEARLSG